MSSFFELRTKNIKTAYRTDTESILNLWRWIWI